MHHRKWLFPALLLFMLSKSSTAQEENCFGLALYSGQILSLTERDNVSQRNLDVFQISPGLSWGKVDGSIQEILLQKSLFRTSQTTLDEFVNDSTTLKREFILNQYEMGLQYSYSYRLPILKGSDRWTLYSGLASSPYLLLGRYKNNESQALNSKSTDIRISFEALFRTRYRIKERFFIDASAVFMLARWNWRKTFYRSIGRDQALRCSPFFGRHPSPVFLRI